MITVSVRDFNTFSQDFYDSVVNALQLHQLKCTCGHAACLSIHAYYHRTVRSSQGAFRLRICRLKCSECGRTHAVLLSSMVPYAQISLESQHQIIQACEVGVDRNTVCTPEGAIDENDVKAVIRRYRLRWHQMLLSASIMLSPISSLIALCFSSYSMQFMQIRGSGNILFFGTT